MALGGKDSKKKREKNREKKARKAEERAKRRWAVFDQMAQDISDYAETLSDEENTRRGLKAEAFKQQWMLTHAPGEDPIGYMRAMTRIVQGLPAEGREARLPREQTYGVRGGLRRRRRRP